ncbi:MAG: nucleotidyltransferase family protein [Candidatus Eisenbacteria bacterium]|uniref:Nucleotidyltransferase family protein n=1 Tax=Eiseniibacteriota bacterium TaxID=2212470 RepID=A0A538TVC8_UNCEI|nr:MAG: nucleotidyltransferase family protein [Candidatus Eisenbacteria bacterium]
MLDLEELCGHLDTMHLATLYAGRLEDLGLYDRFAMASLEALVAFEKGYVASLSNELSRLGAGFKSAGIAPILLKGPTFWSDVYRIRHHRRIYDIDLLVEGPDEAHATCEVLGRLGYARNGEIEELDFHDDSHYRLEPLSAKLAVAFGPGAESWLNRYFDGPAQKRKVQRVDGSSCSIDLQIEVHRGLYKLKDRSYPPIQSDDVEDFELIRPYRRLKSRLNLVLLSVKLWSDAYFGQLNCLKLIRDFIGLLGVSHATTVAESVEVARRWDVASQYVKMLNAACPLMPERELLGLPPPTDDTIETTVRRVLEHAKRGASESRVTMP